MKEHDDGVSPTVKESTATVDSTTADETVTARGKIEGLFGERDDGEDMVVDVVGADVVTDDRGGTKVDLDAKVDTNGSIEEGSEREIASSDKDVNETVTVEEVRVVTVEKVEVVVNDEGVKTSVEVSKEVIQENVVTERDSTKEIVEQHTESVQEVTEKESDVLDSSKVSESFTTTGSRDAHVAAVKEGLFGKDEGEDGVDNQVSSTEAVNTGTSEDNVHLSPKNLDQKLEVDQTEEIMQPTVEVATSDVQESVQEVADEVLDSKKIPDSEIKADGVVVEEGNSGKDEAQDGVSKIPISESTDNSNLNEGLTEKTVKEGTESVQEVADLDNEKTGKDEAFDSTKIPSILSEGTVHENAGDIDQKAEVQMVNEDTSHSTIDVRIDNTQKSESIEGDIAVIDKDKEIVEQQQPVGPVQESVDKDHVMDEKIEKEVEVSEAVDMVVDQKVEVDQKIEGILIENQILNVDTEMKVETFDEVNHATSHQDYGDDAGMDIDEVLGWKDEIPGIDSLNNQEKDQDFKIHTNPGPNLENVLPKVYERRVHVNENLEEEHTDFCRQQETETEPVDQSTLTEDVENNETSVSFNQSSYFHPPEKEGEFSSSDLVWGKVRSHPWWPGQIFDQSDASDKAMKYFKKDRFLVAYFGDRTFAWNDSTVLKPFRAKFSQIEKHTNSEAFNYALHCALEEVSRRVELGLSCSCTPDDIFEKIECQIVENAGIKKDSSKRYGKDKTTLVTSFEPDKLLDYVRLLAKSPYNENDKLDLVMAKAQLLSCARFKGYRQLSEFQICGDLIEDSSELSQPVDQVVKKEKSFTELKVDPVYYSGDGEELSRKRKASDSNSNSDVSEKRPTLESVTPSPKPSFKVGELIQRVATQLHDNKNIDPVDQLASQTTPVNSVNPQSNLPEMLSQLHLTAQDPMKGYTFLNNIIPFFYSHRAAVFTKSLKQNPSGKVTVNVTETKKRKSENDPEDFEFDDVNDSYWTDRIIQNHPEESQQQQPQQQQQQIQLHDSQNGTAEHQIVAYEEQQKPVVIKQSRRSNKKRFFSSNHEIEAKEQTELIERRRLNLATEVVMKFNEGIYFPSEIHLNKMFRRFGPLMESETEVDRQSGRARVVFKKCSDAEVAHSSAGRFSIFGGIAVGYELNYTPLISYKPLPLPIARENADAC